MYNYSMFETPLYRKVMDALPVAILVAMPDQEQHTRSEFNIVFTNTACRSLLIKDREQPTSFSVFMRRLNDEQDWVSLARSAGKAQKPITVGCFCERLAKWLSISLSCPEEQVVLVSFTDITAANDKELFSMHYASEHRAQELVSTLSEKLEQMSYYDSLTGLSNMASYHAAVSAVVRDALKDNLHVGLLLIDIDNLKDINDLRGHTAGDAVLRKAALILSHFERSDISVFRFGGDEFILLAADIGSHNHLINVGDAVLEAFQKGDISVSIGVAMLPEHAQTKDDLLRFADLAMREVKKNGKNGLVVFSTSMQDKFRSRMALETKLQIAVLNNSFEMYFQPQIDIKHNRLRGFEALIRWHDQEQGWISPAAFIPIAEETKLILPIGHWVLERTMGLLKQWQERYGFTGMMSVNVSPVQLKKKGFMDDFLDILRKYEVNPQNIELEITEGVFIDNPEEIIALLTSIRSMGIGIALDDFGTGYSSLNYLQKLPLTVLKIDKSFVQNLVDANSVEHSITESIISLVNKMGLETVAEGIETPLQFSYLKDMRCDFIQGYLFSKPLSLDKCEKLLSGDSEALKELQPDGGQPILYSI